MAYLDPAFLLWQELTGDDLEQAIMSVYETTLALRGSVSDEHGDPLPGKETMWRHYDEANSHIRLAAELSGLNLP